jgi:hypothetical protein
MPNRTYIAKAFTQSPAAALIRLTGSAVRVGDKEPLCVRVSAVRGTGNWRALAVIDHDHGPWLAFWHRDRKRVEHFRVSETVADLTDLLADGWRIVTKAVADRFIGRTT